VDASIRLAADTPGGPAGYARRVPVASAGGQDEAPPLLAIAVRETSDVHRELGACPPRRVLTASAIRETGRAA